MLATHCFYIIIHLRAAPQYLLNFSFSASSIKAVLIFYVCTYKVSLVMSLGRCWLGQEWLCACVPWRKWTPKPPSHGELLLRKLEGKKDKLLTGRHLPTHINFHLVDKEPPLCQSDCQAQIYGEQWVANSTELSRKTKRFSFVGFLFSSFFGIISISKTKQ